MEHRIRSRRREVRWRRFRYLALLGVASVAAGAGGYGYFGPTFRVQAVTVEGVGNPLAKELSVALASGLAKDHVWSISLRLAAGSIARSILGDEVALTRISPSLPSGLVVQAQPIAPVAKVGVGIGVVPAGVVIPLATREGKLPLISICPRPVASVASHCIGRLAVGERVPGALLGTALAATKLAPGATLVDVQGEGVAAILEAGGVCLLGSSRDAAAKLGLCAQLARKNATVDLRGVDSPALVVG